MVHSRREITSGPRKSIENSWHWVLDVTFRKDLGRVRAGHGDENYAIRKRRQWSRRSGKRRLAFMHP